MSNMLLNQTPFHLKKSALPCLIHGVEGSGSSFFTVESTRDMFMQGYKLIFFSAYPMAKEQFLEITQTFIERIGKVYSLEDVDQNKQALLIMENNSVLFSNVVRMLTDINERIIVIKNIETIDTFVLEIALNFENIILSGNIDKNVIKEKILQKEFKTKIFFSQPIEMLVGIPKLNMYEGYLEDKTKSGIVRIVS